MIPLAVLSLAYTERSHLMEHSLRFDACGLHIKILSIKEHRLESAVVCKTTGSENAAEQERSEKNEDK